MSRHIMTDVETLGTKPGSVILSIGAVVFSSDGITEEFYRSIDVLSSLLAGLTVDEATCEWWSKQDPKALGPLLSDPRPVGEILKDFSNFVRKDDYVWAKGVDFDMVMIQEAYRLLNRKIPWSFRNCRCVRTVLGLGQNLGLKDIDYKFTVAQHYALDDAKKQALQVIEVAKHVKGIL